MGFWNACVLFMFAAVLLVTLMSLEFLGTKPVVRPLRRGFKSMTYRQLLEALQKMTPDLLDLDVTIFCEDSGGYYAATRLSVAEEDDTLDKGHPFLE